MSSVLPSHISLSQFCQSVSLVLNECFPHSCWVAAEISELNVRNGHCYMELVEKQVDGTAVIAKLRAMCWTSKYAMLRTYFEQQTGQALRSGIQVLFEVQLNFHAQYGLSLTVLDVDPTYTLGDMARQRQEVIARLTADGVMDMNKQLPLSVLPKRVAVISSPTAAGYGDFIHQLEGNALGYVFYTQLFPALMQGEKAEASIIAALDAVYDVADRFDVVVIIRGGGAITDLTCFDAYDLALNCTQFPLPILSGIGHQRDVSVLDMVAHTSLKTPTAVAEFLVQQFQEQEQHVDGLLQRLSVVAQNFSAVRREQLIRLEYRVAGSYKRQLVGEEAKLEVVRMRLLTACDMRLERERNALGLQLKLVEMHSPTKLLEKGYTLTLVDGKPVRSVADLSEGQCLSTEFADGRVESVVVACHT